MSRLHQRCVRTYMLMCMNEPLACRAPLRAFICLLCKYTEAYLTPTPGDTTADLFLGSFPTVRYTTIFLSVQRRICVCVCQTGGFCECGATLLIKSL